DSTTRVVRRSSRRTSMNMAATYWRGPSRCSSATAVVGQRAVRIHRNGGGRVAVAAVVVAAMLTACSSSSSSKSTTPVTPQPKQTSQLFAPAPSPDQVVALVTAAGLQAEPAETLVHHVHAHLDVFVNGERKLVPAG